MVWVVVRVRLIYVTFKGGSSLALTTATTLTLALTLTLTLNPFPRPRSRPHSSPSRSSPPDDGRRGSRYGSARVGRREGGGGGGEGNGNARRRRTRHCSRTLPADTRMDGAGRKTQEVRRKTHHGEQVMEQRAVPLVDQRVDHTGEAVLGRWGVEAVVWFVAGVVRGVTYLATSQQSTSHDM